MLDQSPVSLVASFSLLCLLLQEKQTIIIVQKSLQI